MVRLQEHMIVGSFETHKRVLVLLLLETTLPIDKDKVPFLQIRYHPRFNKLSMMPNKTHPLLLSYQNHQTWTHPLDPIHHHHRNSRFPLPVSLPL
jgi:hypothetical protein